MQAIYICSLFFVVIFLPISIKLQGVLSDGKFYFSSSIYSVSLLGGYAQINGKNLNIHISDKRAISLKVANLIEKRNLMVNLI